MWCSGQAGAANDLLPGCTPKRALFMSFEVLSRHRHWRRRLRASRSRVVVSIYPQIARRTVEQCARLTDYGAESKP